jgi:transcription elongation factor Elf1
MKAYDKCPGCDTINRSTNAKINKQKPYYSVICKDCGKLYYQTVQYHNIKNIEIDSKHIEPVPYIKGHAEKHDEYQQKQESSTSEQINLV